MLRKCAMCKQYKKELEFPKRGKYFHSYCKACKKLADKQYRVAKRELDKLGND